jgi:osmotically-inducible protein OsmY
MGEQSTDPYATEHLRDALAKDPRVNALDVQVRRAGDALVITGNTATAEHRDAIGEVVAELAPDARIRNDVTLTDLREPPGQEVVS